MKVLFISHTFDHGVFKVGSHHLTREMSRLGMEVAHVTTPFSIAHFLFSRSEVERRRLALCGVRIDADGVKHLIPRTVLPAQYSSDAYLHQALRDVDMERPDYLFLDQPLMLSADLLSRATIAVYRPTDLYLHGMAWHLQTKYVQRFTAVAATSHEVLSSLTPTLNQPRTVIPNGVEYSRFAAPGLPAVRNGVVYVGAFDSRFDWTTVIHMARSLPAIPFSLVGPGALPPGNLPANMRVIGAMKYEDVPQYLRRFAVGLLPLSSDPQNAGRSPMKLFEYLASGLHVVATGLSGLIGRTDLPGVLFYSNPDDAVGALTDALAIGGSNAAGIESARAQDWSVKAKQLLSFANSARCARHHAAHT